MSLKQLIGSLALSLCVWFSAQAARVSGTIRDDKGEALAFATVYVEGTTLGTVANPDGEYAIDVPAGSQTLSFRLLGFQPKREKLEVGTSPIRLDVVLKAEVIQTAEVSVVAGEDPAVAIMRKAIAQRDFYAKQVDAYSCRAYIKGLNRLTKAPKKFMGKPITIPGLDSSNKGIIYFSEAVSDYYFQQPDKEKEVMIASKVAGQPNGFSFNNYAGFRFDFLKNRVKLDFTARPLVSPLSNNAFFYYRFYLIDTYQSEGRTTHKIRVVPRRKNDPVFRGIVYVQDSTWRLEGAQLFVTRQAGMEILDTVHIEQTFIPVTPQVWLPGSSNFRFRFKFMGLVEGEGYFVNSLSQYKVNEPLALKLDNEVMRIEKGANEKSTAYWDSVRVAPLTNEEARDYVKKDSLRTIMDSDKYKDSIDRKRNKFGWADALFGYSYNNTKKKYRLTFKSPLTQLQFNTVEGLVLAPSLTYLSYDEDRKHNYSFSQTLRYGFASERLYGTTTLGYSLRRGENPFSVALSAGNTVRQFNSRAPITEIINSVYTLMDESNFMKLYEEAFAGAAAGGSLATWLNGSLGLTYGRRSPLQNNTDYTWRDQKNKQYETNNPRSLEPVKDAEGKALARQADAFVAHNYLIVNGSLTFTFARPYMTTPKGRVFFASPYPRLSISYRKAIPGMGPNSPDWDLVRIGTTDSYESGLLGETRYALYAGGFLRNKVVPFMDAAHFMGNQTLIGNDERDGFQLLPYYTWSTTDWYGEAHAEHAFNGFISNKIPLVRKAKIKEFLGANYLHTDQLFHYTELVAGLSFFGVARVDYVRAFNYKNGNREGIRFRLDI